MLKLCRDERSYEYPLKNSETIMVSESCSFFFSLNVMFVLCKLFYLVCFEFFFFILLPFGFLPHFKLGIKNSCLRMCEYI